MRVGIFFIGRLLCNLSGTLVVGLEIGLVESCFGHSCVNVWRDLLYADWVIMLSKTKFIT